MKRDQFSSLSSNGDNYIRERKKKPNPQCLQLPAQSQHHHRTRSPACEKETRQGKYPSYNSLSSADHDGGHTKYSNNHRQRQHLSHHHLPSGTPSSSFPASSSSSSSSSSSASPSDAELDQLIIDLNKGVSIDFIGGGDEEAQQLKTVFLLGQEKGHTQRELSSETVHLASMYIRDGQSGRKVDYDIDPASIHKYHSFHSRAWNQIFTIVCLLHIFSAVINTPAESPALILKFLFEVFATIVYIYDLIKYFRFFGIRSWASPWPSVRGIVIFVIALDLIIRWLTNFRSYHFGRALRPFVLLFRRHKLRTLFLSCMSTVPKILMISLMIWLHISLYAFLAYVLFKTSFNDQALRLHADLAAGDGSDFMQTHSEYSSHTGASSRALAFDTLAHSFYNMLLVHSAMVQVTHALLSDSSPFLNTTMDYSPFNTIHRVFFISFVCIGNLILLKLAVAVAYQTFHSHTGKIREMRRMNRKLAYIASFELLAEDHDQDIADHGRVGMKPNDDDTSDNGSWESCDNDKKGNLTEDGKTLKTAKGDDGKDTNGGEMTSTLSDSNSNGNGEGNHNHNGSGARPVKDGSVEKKEPTVNGRFINKGTGNNKCVSCSRLLADHKTDTAESRTRKYSNNDNNSSNTNLSVEHSHNNDADCNSNSNNSQHNNSSSNNSVHEPGNVDEAVKKNKAISLKVWSRLFRRLRPDLGTSALHESMVLYEVLREKSPNQYIGFDEYTWLCDVTPSYIVVSRMPFGASESPWKSFIHQLYYKHGWIAVSGKAVRLDYMHIFYWCLLVLTTIETLCVTKYASMDLYLTRIGAHASPSISAAAAQALSMYHMWYSIGVVLLLVFWVDMWMKVTCFGWKWYWSSDVFNIIDLCSNVLSVLCLLAERLRFLEMLLYHPTTIHMLCDTANVHRHNQSLDGDGAGLDTTGCSVSLDTKKYLATRLSSIFAFCMALRLFRLVRIFQFTALYEKAASAFSAYGVIFRLLYFFFSMVYVFAIIGQDIFGHVLVQDNTNLRGTGWWPFRSVLNYSSFMPAFNTVFNLITLASWTVVMDAAVKATSPLACVYFFACRFVGELLFLPLFIGYILDVIVKEFADWDVRMGKVDAYTNYSNSNRNDRTNNSNRSYTINNNAFFQVELGNRDIDSSL